VNDLKLITSHRAQRARGSRWLAAVFATIVVAGSFAGCTDVLVDPPTCSTCPPAAVKYDTIVVTDTRPDTIYLPHDEVMVKATTYIDSTFRNQVTKDTTHSRDTVVRTATFRREPIREVTILMRNKSGVVQPITVKVPTMSLDVVDDDRGLPKMISFEASVAIARYLSERDFDKSELHSLNIFLPEGSFSPTAQFQSFPLNQLRGEGASAWLYVKDQILSTGKQNGEQNNATLKIYQQSIMYRRRIMEITFNGTFHPTGSGSNDSIVLNLNFRVSY
jgi:hypothetical protein